MSLFGFTESALTSVRGDHKDTQMDEGKFASVRGSQMSLHNQIKDA